MHTYQLQEGLILTEYESEIMRLDGLTITVHPIWKWLLSK